MILDLSLVIVAGLITVLGSLILTLLFKLLRKTDIISESISDIKNELKINSLKTNFIGNYMSTKDKSFRVLWTSMMNNARSSNGDNLKEANEHLQKEIVIAESKDDFSNPNSPL